MSLSSSGRDGRRPFVFDNLVPTICLIVLAITISWPALGDDRTTTKGWFLAWYEQFRHHEVGEFPYSPFPPTAVLIEGGIPSLFQDPNLGEDVWHMIVLALLGAVLFSGFRVLAGPFISFASAAIWICLEGNSAGNFIGGYFETANLFVAASCTCALHALSSRPRWTRHFLIAAGFFATLAAGVKQSFLPFVVILGASLIFVSMQPKAKGEYLPDSRKFDFLLGSGLGLILQLLAWQIFFPSLEPRAGLSRFLSGGGKSDSVIALVSSAANSLTPLNLIAPVAIVTFVLLALNEIINRGKFERFCLAGSAISGGASGFFFWTLPASSESSAVRLAISIWAGVLLMFAIRRRVWEARLVFAIAIGVSAFVFISAFRDMIGPERQNFLVTMRGLAVAPYDFGVRLAALIGFVGLLSALFGLPIGSRNIGPMVQRIALASGVLVLFQIPLGGFSLTGHLFGFGMIAMFDALARRHSYGFRLLARGVVIMLALSGIVREAVYPYEWYGVLGSNDLAQIKESGVFVGRGASETENRFEHAMLSHELMQLDPGSEVLVGVRNAGLAVGHEHLKITQECLVLWFDICPEVLSSKVFEDALEGKFDFALWSSENPDVLFANTLMWRDNGSQLGNPSPTAVAQLQAWLLSLVDAEPSRLVHVAWPDREYGTETFLVDLREAVDLGAT